MVDLDVVTKPNLSLINVTINLLDPIVHVFPRKKMGDGYGSNISIRWRMAQECAAKGTIKCHSMGRQLISEVGD